MPPFLALHNGFTLISPHNFSRAFAVIEAFLQMNGFCSWGAVCLFASPTATWGVSSSLLVPPGDFHWLQIHPQTLQRNHLSRLPRGKTADWSFRCPPSPLTLLFQSPGAQYWDLTVSLLQQGLIPPPSFLDHEGRQPTVKGVWRNMGQQWTACPIPGQNSESWCLEPPNRYEVHWAKLNP